MTVCDVTDLHSENIYFYRGKNSKFRKNVIIKTRKKSLENSNPIIVTNINYKKINQLLLY